MQEKFKIENKDGIKIINYSGELDAYNVLELKSTISDMVKKSYYKIILNFSEIEHINSTALGVLVGRLKEIREKNGDLVLINLSPHIYKIFDMVGAAKIFNIFTNLDEALDFFRS